MLQALKPTRDPGWVLTHDGYDVLTRYPDQEDLG